MKEPTELNITRIYQDVSSEERDKLILKFKALLLSRHPRQKDDDLVIYIAHLFFALSFPEFYDMAEPYIFKNPEDILKAIKSTDDKTIRYFILKVNADRLLTMMLFDDKFISKSRIDYAAIYYREAETWRTKIYRKQTELSTVLIKLSAYTGYYVDLFKNTLKDRNKIIENFNDKKFENVFQTLQSMRTMDELLDDYNNGVITFQELKNQTQQYLKSNKK